MSVAGNANSVRHGGYSDRLVAAKARAHRRRFLRRAGLKAAALDAVTAGYLEQWARGTARLDLFDAGAIDTGDYWTAYNATHRVAKALERRLVELGLDRPRQAEPSVADMLAERRAGR